MIFLRSEVRFLAPPARLIYWVCTYCTEYLHIIPPRLVSDISFIGSFLIPVYLQQFTARDRYKPPADHPYKQYLTPPGIPLGGSNLIWQYSS